MAIDISKLFSDITGPANTDLVEGEARLNAMNTPGGMAALLSPQRARAMRQGLGGLFGQGGGMTPQEQVPEAMRGLDINDPNSIAQVIRKLNAIGATKEAAQLKLGLDQLMAEEKRAQGEAASLVQRRQQQTAIETAQLSEQVRVNKLAEEQEVEDRQQEKKAGSVLREEGFGYLSDLVGTGQLTTAQAVQQRNSSTEWMRLNNTQMFRRDGELRDVPGEADITPFNIGGLAVGLDVTTGKVVWTQDLSQVQPIGGGSPTVPSDASDLPVSTQSKDYMDKLTLAIQGSSALNQSIEQAISTIGDSALPLGLGNRSTGFIPSVVNAVSGEDGVVSSLLLQPKRNLETILNTVGSNVAFDRLQKMRDESKTGGALGNVSNIELDLLRSSIGVLSTNADPELLLAGLKAVQRHYENFIQASMGIMPMNIDFDDPRYGGRLKRSGGEIWVRDEEDPTGWWTVPNDEVLEITNLGSN